MGHHGRRRRPILILARTARRPRGRGNVRADRAPWRLSLAGLACLADGDTFAFPDEGPTERRGGIGSIEQRARASVVRYIRVLDERLQVWAGGGLFAAVRRIEHSTLIFDAGGSDERAVGGNVGVEQRVGGVIALPVVFEITDRAALVLEPELRVRLYELVFFGPGDGQATLRLNL